LAVIVGVYLGLTFDFRALYDSQVNEGSLERLELWQMNLEHVIRHPLFGMGPAGHTVYNMTYHPQDARSTHNNYFDVLAQTGVVGFAAFIWMLATFVAMGVRLLRAVRHQRSFEEAFAAATLAGCAAALASMLLGDWVLPFAYNQTITGFDNASFTWLFLGGMASLYRITR
jgi:O-antigen ligase